MYSAVGRFAADGFGEPFSNCEVLAEVICGGRGFEQLRKEFGAVGQGGAEDWRWVRDRVRCGSGLFRRLQGRQLRETIDDIGGQAAAPRIFKTGRCL
jgi:hypothetical protein